MFDIKKKSGLLRCRPGHLTNFSGGAGYMPFVFIPSAIISAIFHFIAIALLSSREKNSHAKGQTLPPKTLPHLIVLIILESLAAGFFFYKGLDNLYGSTSSYALATLGICSGPWLAAVILQILFYKRTQTFFSVSMGLSFLFIILWIPLTIFIAFFFGILNPGNI